MTHIDYHHHQQVKFPLYVSDEIHSPSSLNCLWLWCYVLFFLGSYIQGRGILIDRSYSSNIISLTMVPSGVLFCIHPILIFWLYQDYFYLLLVHTPPLYLLGSSLIRQYLLLSWSWIPAQYILCRAVFFIALFIFLILIGLYTSD